MNTHDIPDRETHTPTLDPVSHPQSDPAHPLCPSYKTSTARPLRRLSGRHLPSRSANAALVDAQHQCGLDDVGQRLHLLVPEHCLEHREHILPPKPGGVRNLAEIFERNIPTFGTKSVFTPITTTSPGPPPRSAIIGSPPRRGLSQVCFTAKLLLRPGALCA